VNIIYEEGKYFGKNYINKVNILVKM